MTKNTKSPPTKSNRGKISHSSHGKTNLCFPMAEDWITDPSLEDICFTNDDHHMHFNNHEFAGSDSEYADMLQLQESIMASIVSRQNLSPHTPSSSNPNPILIGKQIAESSHSFCEICAEEKQNNQMFRVSRCSHSFCSDCITKYVSVKIQENLTTVTCPGLNCSGVLQLDTCKAVIPKEVSDRWDEALTESLILASQKFYCPFKDCSAVLVNDATTEEVIRESECPECRRLFCAQCRSPWHSGIKCGEFQKLNVDERGREDLMVRELAKTKNWARCPQCKFYVEKNQGCLHIVCRCKFEFCYACGGKWRLLHVCTRRPSF